MGTYYILSAEEIDRWFIRNDIRPNICQLLCYCDVLHRWWYINCQTSIISNMIFACAVLYLNNVLLDKKEGLFAYELWYKHFSITNSCDATFFNNLIWGFNSIFTFSPHSMKFLHNLGKSLTYEEKKH